jgi:hypothetical protein
MTERLLKRHDSGPVSDIGGYIDECYSLDGEALRAEYTSLVRSAPTRAEEEPYVVEHGTRGRDTKTGDWEKPLARRLYVSRSILVLDTDSQLSVVDYEIPLNSVEADELGEVDLLGVGHGLWVIELKVLRPTNSADTPLNALTEAIGYCAVVQQNKARIESEVRSLGRAVSTGVVSVLVLAPNNYWEFWGTRRDKRPWRPAMAHAAGVITEATEVPIHFGSFDSTTIGPTVPITDPLK